jgi:DNA-directed RNA polymerase subunit RPC12/RpoP
VFSEVKIVLTLAVHPAGMDLFRCTTCGAKYRVKSVFWYPSKDAVCEDCGAAFPKMKSGSFLMYERGKAVVEQSVGEIDRV